MNQSHVLSFLFTLAFTTTVTSLRNAKGSFLTKTSLQFQIRSGITYTHKHIKDSSTRLNWFSWFRSSESKDSQDNFATIEETLNLEKSIRLYFESWNKRDMVTAISVFDDDCKYEDTLYPKPFEGKVELESHLINVASSLPPSFLFVIDYLAIDNDSLRCGVQWHVESNGIPLPFTRGSSMYIFNENGKIVQGFDVPEPLIKSGNISLEILKASKNFVQEPKRLFAIFAWFFYIWFVFLSNVAPGPNVLSLDAHTWTEVYNLSLNYLLIQPIFLPFLSQTEYFINTHSHPYLEVLFNIVLLWSLLFGGFIIDGKIPSLYSPNKQTNKSGTSNIQSFYNNQIITTSNTYSNITEIDDIDKELSMPIDSDPLISDRKKTSFTNTKVDENIVTKNYMLPVIIGMQFLTNAFYLPYLVSRSKIQVLSQSLTAIDSSSGNIYLKTIDNDVRANIYATENLSNIEKFFESKIFPIIVFIFSLLCIYWIQNGRIEEFSNDFSIRYSSFMDILKSDRLGFSFMVDSIYYTIFQSWLIDDDIQRRTSTSTSTTKVSVESETNTAGAQQITDIINSLIPNNNNTNTNTNTNLEEKFKYDTLKRIGKYVPFFGLIYYFYFRPSLKVK